MASAEVLTPKSSTDKSSRFYVVAWINKLLKTNFKDVREMGSGSCHCQIMDRIFPGCVDMTMVKFDTQREDDHKHNFSLLLEALNKKGITRDIPVEKLIAGDFKSNFELIKWFKVLYKANVKSKEATPVKARDSREIAPILTSSYVWNSKSQSDTERNGIQHVQTKKHQQRARNAQGAGHASELRPYSDAAARFIRSHFYSGSAGGERVMKRFAHCKVGLEYPKDITSVCQHTPYCVYVYEGVTVGKGDTVSVLLVGFFDVEASCHRIRFLDAFQSVDGSGDQTAAGVVQTVQKFGLSTDNLAAVYFSGNGAASEKICSQLRELNPNVIALGSLYSIADAACLAGVKQLSGQAQELLVDLEARYSSSSTKSDKLKALFGSDKSENSELFHIDTSCLRFCLLATKTLEIWTDLILHFSSCDEDDEKAKLICSKLTDPKVKATFMFLEQALKPLQTFHRQTQGASWDDMLLILEGASTLLNTYTSYFLQPHAAVCYLKENDAYILRNKKFYFSSPELNLGGKAVEDFLNKAEAAEVLPQFQKEVLSFYIAVTGCIAERLPLSDTLMKSTVELLRPQKRMKVTAKEVKELGAKLGVCSSPEEAKRLTSEFLENQHAEERDGEEGANDGPALVLPEKHWASVLTNSNPASLFRRLLLTLLSFRCPPRDAQQVFTQRMMLQQYFLRVKPHQKVTVTPHLTTLSLAAPPTPTPTFTVEGATRGGSDWESSLRQKPQARTVFQAGVGTWSKPIGVDMDDQNGLESKDEVPEEKSPSSKPTPTRARRKHGYQDGKGLVTGELVWGKLKDLPWWPGMVMAWKTKSAPPAMRRVKWFEDGLFSELHTENLLPFSAFTRCFCKNSFASLPKYKEAIYQVTELAGERCHKSFAEAKGDKEKELKAMLDWAFGGFLPSGPEGFALPESSPNQESPDSSQSDYQPRAKRKYVFRNRANTAVITFNRELLIEKVKETGKSIEVSDFCLSCGSSDIDVQHPLFQGGLCVKCKVNFSETLYRYDEDGYQSYCTVCCAGSEVILCDNISCCRCFCKDCLEILVDKGTFDRLKEVNPWSCFMCEPSQCEGNLKLRAEWSVKVQDFFANSSAMEFEPHRVYPCIPAHKRRPLKVLSLFDGIATGYLVLRDLGFKIERYLASEICYDSIAVGMVKHEGKIEYVNDVRTITRKHLAEWGPFDLLIGGSPCNDLSMVNPNRKGLFEGTGRLFFEFYRILTLLRPKEEDNRPFFWLFENVVFMSANDKSDICRFLECNPVLIDAVKVSPAHRARYFWGNLPGMNRPLATSLDDKLTLQDCLEAGREAKFDKVRTITTKQNSIRQGKTGPLPVSMNGQEDYLWCTEMEQIFGFPKHYTDVNNMGRVQRQKVLGRSWCVPVIRHLLAPLKDYFECEERQ
ncbi:DNA (cytosine-5-)-methyltransferase 3 beta, duplicate a [Xenentodon cancila]